MSDLQVWKPSTAVTVVDGLICLRTPGQGPVATWMLPEAARFLAHRLMDAANEAEAGLRPGEDLFEEVGTALTRALNKIASGKPLDGEGLDD